MSAKAVASALLPVPFYFLELMVGFVQALLAPELREFGEQVIELRVASGAKLMEAVLELPFNAAVMTAV